MFARIVRNAVVRTPTEHPSATGSAVAARVRRTGRLVAATGTLAMVLGAGSAQAADTCPNAALRTGASAALGECRAYELVSPDLNHAALGLQPAGHASAEGNTMVYQTIDAPDNATSGSVFNLIRATRDGAKGWGGASLSPRMSDLPTVYLAANTTALAPDLLSTVEVSDQRLDPGTATTGQNLFVRRAGGPYKPVTIVGSPLLGGLEIYFAPAFLWGTPDFSHIYFLPKISQLPGVDPLPSDNTYSWSEADGVQLLGILPDHTPAPNGAGITGGVLEPGSADGKYMLFTADGQLYLRINGTDTVEVSATQRTVHDINPGPGLSPVSGSNPASVAGITADGSTVLFTARSELTNDAYTGRTGGLQTDAGRDLYSYDTTTGDLTDLTVGLDPADVATGANVQNIVGSTSDGSYVYFTATGVLASGATPGHTSLYLWHDGQITFISEAGGIVQDPNTGLFRFYMTPDGRHFAVATTDRLTGYDNSDPVTSAPHSQVYTRTLGSAYQCASCRADGSRPTGDSTLPPYKGLPPNSHIRPMSDDGRRVFFHSTDAVVPQATSGHQQVFEYSSGKASPISGTDGAVDATFLDASASGDDVFFTTYQELVPNRNGGDSAVYDARVGGGFAVAPSQRCASIACQAPATPAPVLSPATSVTFLGEGNVADEEAGSAALAKVSVSKVKTITGSVGSLKVKVPGKGRLTVSGSGLLTKRSSPSKAQTLTVRVQLTSAAARTLKRKRSLKTKVKVAFVDSGGEASSVTLSLSFKAASARKGR